MSITTEEKITVIERQIESLTKLKAQGKHTARWYDAYSDVIKTIVVADNLAQLEAKLKELRAEGNNQ